MNFFLFGVPYWKKQLEKTIKNAVAKSQEEAWMRIPRSVSKCLLYNHFQYCKNSQN